MVAGVPGETLSIKSELVNSTILNCFEGSYSPSCRVTPLGFRTKEKLMRRTVCAVANMGKTTNYLFDEETETVEVN